ncbi:MAG: 16S rRNA (adenine(1518)-N(6)/adenine(1519)-N(6))-dimethyltransferase RsmA [Deltaproteobacteria bacterium]|nr:16S rRNA (adenine(1518)-N(6)/adenine(1519)-N(6))-dimethyltransferase RsmA [Deltaproteobacteria bacterium]
MPHPVFFAEHPRKLLAELGISPSKRLGQNFLHDRNVARKIVALAETLGGPFLEIGPGLGALTGLLAEAGHETVAVEVDRRLCAFLRERLGGSGVEVLEADFLAVGEASFRRMFPSGGIVVGNLPYSISSPVVLRLLELRDIFPRAVLMLQKEVAERLCAPPGGKEYGILSVYLGALSASKVEFPVRRSCFTPSPEVDSAVLSVRFRPGVPEALVDVLRTVVRAAFARRRKALRNAPVPFLPGGSGEWVALLAAAGIDPGARAETVPPEGYLALARAAGAGSSREQG